MGKPKTRHNRTSTKGKTFPAGKGGTKKPKFKYGQLIEMPSHFKRTDIQWKGEIDGEYVEVYYDDKASQLTDSNIYSVFSNKGFLSFLAFGFSNYELTDAVKKYKNKPTNYQTELKRSF